MINDETPARLVTIRPRAVEDLERHADYLEVNAALETARRFRTAIMEAIDRIVFMPGAGAPRELRNALLRDLRMYVIPDFRNYLVFYLTPEGSIEIVRVIHGSRDIRGILEDEE